MRKKFFKVVTDCGHTVEYDTAYELGFIVGSKNMKMHDQYEPIHLESEEFNEGRLDGKKARLDGMTKRESGWYRVRLDGEYDFRVAKYLSEPDKWLIHGYECGMHNEDFAEIKEMVMTTGGQIVYNQPAHDPLYNTKQEG
ncbi:MAG: hypothetical protein ACRDC6_19940 [Shewanella sp.]